KGNKRIWRVNKAGAANNIVEGEISVIEKAGRIEIVKKTRMPEGKKPKTLWKDSKYSATTHGTKLLINILGRQVFSYPKPFYLVKDCICFWIDKEDLILDFFAGSGTTAHAVINLNREDGGRRKYILVEVGDYFDTVLKPRIQKVVYSQNWKDGKPVPLVRGKQSPPAPLNKGGDAQFPLTKGGDAQSPLSKGGGEAGESNPPLSKGGGEAGGIYGGVSHCFKYLRLESYEDALNNIELKRSKKQDEALLEGEDQFREDYMLSYMIDVESQNSASLLNIDAFENPFHYQMDIATGDVGEAKPTHIDLVETFNYLIGLKIKHIDYIKGFRVIEGENLDGDRILVIWRNCREKSNQDLDDFFQKQGYNTKDQEYDLIYVNGDNNLQNLRRDDQTWKVRLIDEEFKRLMFDVKDV
ncbi:MAG: DNA methyltransferase, partial [Candidatus Hinthialibacter sp.]